MRARNEQILKRHRKYAGGKAGYGWLVICPAHNDHHPSLWVKPSKRPDFVVDLACQAKCTNEAVLKALNLTWANISRNGRKNEAPQSEIEAVYHYVDANGKPFEVVRTNPKGFYQRQPDGKGGYLKERQKYGKEHYSMAGIQYALYHLNEIKTAITRGELMSGEVVNILDELPGLFTTGVNALYFIDG